jgi:putative photosynthetic complex assembly protein 2
MQMAAMAIGFAVFAWWFSTGAILLLLRLSPFAREAVMAVATAIAVLALFGVQANLTNTTVAGAFAGFSYGLLIWAWHEMSFLFGFITGPRRTSCPDGLAPGARFRAAFETILHHELAILATGALLLWLSWGADNQIALWTFTVLWAMRISAKLNVFLGAPNLAEEFLPEHLGYLKSYFRRDRINGLFPVVITLSSIALGWIIHLGLTTPDPFMATGVALVGAFLALAIIEHWFFVLPIPDAALWRWALRAQDEDEIARGADYVLAPARGSTRNAETDKNPSASQINSTRSDCVPHRMGETTGDQTAVVALEWASKRWSGSLFRQS